MPDVYALTAGDDAVYAALSSGLIRSRDGGRTWQALSAAPGSEDAIAATSLALAAEGTLFAGVPGGVLRSPDGGETWQAAWLPTPAPFVTALAVSPGFDQDQTAFAASLEDGVFRSSDGGAHWSSWNFGLLDLQALALAISPDFARDQTLYAGTGSGLFASRNAGRAWREVRLPCGHLPVLSLACAAGRLLAGTEGDGLYASSDGGKSWEPGGMEGMETVDALVCDGDAALALAAGRLYLSRDGGLSWEARAPAGQQVPAAICAGRPPWAAYADGSVVRVDM